MYGQVSAANIAYTASLEDAIVETVRQAKASLQPARMGIGNGLASRGSDFTLVEALGQILGEEAVRASERVHMLDRAPIRGAQRVITSRRAL